MSFIPFPDNWDKVTCMKMSHDRKFLAVGGKFHSDNSAYILIYQYIRGSLELKTKIQDSKDQTNNREFKTIGFSWDIKFICGYTFPDTHVYQWEWTEQDSERANSVTNATIERISICPKDKHLVCTTGQQHIRLWIIQNKEFKSSPLHIDEKQNFRDHAWLDEEKIVVCNDSGDIYIIDRIKGEAVQKSNAFGVNELDHYSISCICPYSKGFFLGSDEGIMALWVRSEENNKTTGKELYDFIRKWSGAEKMRVKIVSISINSMEDMLAVGFASNDIGVCDIASIGLNQDFKRAREFMDKDVKFEIICQGFHYRSISSMDVAIQKPLIVTCSKDDATIRIWNYINFRCELAKKFYIKEESKGLEATRPITCVAFHPSGYYIGAGFIDKVRFYHVLYNFLRLYREIEIKNSNQLCFSHGGQFILISTEVKEIFLYNAYSLIPIVKFKGPTMSIINISFSSNDVYFTVSSNDGSLSVYNATTFEKIADSDLPEHKPGSSYSGVVMADYIDELKLTKDKESAPKINKLVAVGTQGTYNGIIRYFVNSKMEAEQQFPETVLTKMDVVECIWEDPKVTNVIVGSDKGELYTFTYPPNNALATKGLIDKMIVHKGGVTSIKSSVDGRFVFSAGEDGALCIYTVNTYDEYGKKVEDMLDSENKDKEKRKDDRILIVGDQLSEILLLEKKDLDEFNLRQLNLTNQINHIQAELEQNRIQQEQFLKEQISRAEKKREEEVKTTDLRIRQLQEQQLNIIKDFTTKLKDKELDHQKAIDELQLLYEKKLTTESDKLLKLEQDNVEIAHKFQAQIEELKAKYEKSIDELISEFKKDFQQLQELNVSEKNISSDLNKKYEDKLNQLEEEHESEVKELERKQKKELTELQTSNEARKEEKDKYKSEKKLAKAKLEEIDTRVKDLQGKHKEFMGQIEIKKQYINSLENEAKTSIDELNKKKVKLAQCKSKIYEMLQNKSIATETAKKNEDKIKPKEKQILNMKDQLLKVESQFDSEIKQMHEMSKTLDKQDARIKQLLHAQEIRQVTYREKDNQLFAIIQDINNTVSNKKEKDYVLDMKTLYEKYVKNANLKLLERLKKDPRNVADLERQIKHLENSLTAVKKQSNTKVSQGKSSLKQRINENKMLIEELNRLRKENEDLSKENKRKEEELTICLTSTYKQPNEQVRSAKELLPSSSKSIFVRRSN